VPHKCAMGVPSVKPAADGSRTTCRVTIATDQEQQASLERRKMAFHAAVAKDVGQAIKVRAADIVITDSYRGGGAFNTIFAVHGAGKDDICPFITDAMERNELRFGNVLNLIDSGSRPIQATDISIVERT